MRHADAGINHAYDIWRRTMPGKAMTHQEIAKLAGLSKQAVQQIEAKALKKLRKRIKQELKQELIEQLQNLNRPTNEVTLNLKEM